MYATYTHYRNWRNCHPSGSTSSRECNTSDIKIPCRAILWCGSSCGSSWGWGILLHHVTRIRLYNYEFGVFVVVCTNMYHSWYTDTANARPREAVFEPATTSNVQRSAISKRRIGQGILFWPLFRYQIENNKNEILKKCHIANMFWKVQVFLRVEANLQILVYRSHEHSYIMLPANYPCSKSSIQACKAINVP